jgi:hypothetical protein
MNSVEEQIAASLLSISVKEMDEFVNKVGEEIKNVKKSPLDEILMERFRHSANITSFLYALGTAGPVAAYLTSLEVGMIIGWYARQKFEEVEALRKLEVL